MLAKRLIKSNDAGGGACTNTVDLYNPFPDGGGVALYQLNGDATDVSGNYDGTATNVTYGAGQFGQAGVFSNNVSRSVVEASISLGSVKTISHWIKFSQFQADNIHIFSSSSNNLQLVLLNGTREFAFYDGISTKLFGSVFPNDFNWHHLVWILNGTSTSLYLDGILVSTITTASTTQSDIVIGSNSGVSGVVGSIDQVRIFSRALRPYEVEALYTEEYCTPTIVPSEHFNTVTYTGTGSTGTQIPVGFQPDFVWIKSRSNPSWNSLQDSVRGATKTLFSNETNAEVTYTNAQTSFDANGFTLGSDTEGGSVNVSGRTYAAWNFKAGGAAVTNTDGTITSQVSANTEAGFSVITTTTNGSGYLNCGHGLGTKPSVVLIKQTNGASTWYMYHKGTSATPQDDAMQLNSTSAVWNAGTYGANKWALSDTVIASGTAQWYYAANSPFVIYSFAEVEGFSNFGSYVGTGAAGNTVVTGFEPAFVMIKRTDALGGWLILDNKRDTTNPRDLFLSPNTSQAEFPVTNGADFLDNGFVMQSTNGSLNANGGKYIYMAFAADPTAVEPTLEDSFNTVLYTGNGGTQSITGAGFQPDLVWTKSRTTSVNHNIVDSVRGLGDNVFKALFPNTSDAENTTTANNVLSLDSNGFTIQGGGTLTNANGVDYVAWNWKGAEIPAINSNGSIPSVVSANPAAGFSIVTHTSNMLSSKSIGHGLNSTPKIVMSRVRNIADSWWVFMPDVIGSTNVLELNSNAAARSVGLTFNANDTTFNIQWTSASYNFLHYCFAEVAGFSKFGSYTGTGTTLQTIDCGFEPAFVLIKNSNHGNVWTILDNKRNPSDPRNLGLFPSSAQVEYTFPGTPNGVSFVSNGFTLNTNQPEFNQVETGSSGGDYIYMAFANQF